MPEMITVSESGKTAATVSLSGSEVSAVAYQLWVERGSPLGSDQEDWFCAEAILENALVATCEDLLRRPAIPRSDIGTESEVLAELASEGLQGHWEVWEREWVGARWVCNKHGSGVGVSSQARSSSKAA